MPSEAKWEYACRAGTAVSRYGSVGAVAWYDGNSGEKTDTVGRKQANAWGLFDMLGNVWEWGMDNWYKNNHNAPMDSSAWERNDPACVWRGGSWLSDAKSCRAPRRALDYHHYVSRGFRVAVVLASGVD